MLKNIGLTFFDYLLKNSHSELNRNLLTFVLNRKIAFNLPHKIRIEALETAHALVSLPLIKRNTNHLGSIHACAIATIGEFAAGLTLLKDFGIRDYRLIMKDIHVEFKKQATSNLQARVRRKESTTSAMLKDLTELNSCVIQIETSVTDTNDLEIATVKTTWQLKKWSDTKFKAS